MTEDWRRRYSEKRERERERAVRNMSSVKYAI